MYNQNCCKHYFLRTCTTNTTPFKQDESDASFAQQYIKKYSQILPVLLAKLTNNLTGTKLFNMQKSKIKGESKLPLSHSPLNFRELVTKLHQLMLRYRSEDVL